MHSQPSMAIEKTANTDNLTTFSTSDIQPGHIDDIKTSNTMKHEIKSDRRNIYDINPPKKDEVVELVRDKNLSPIKDGRLRQSIDHDPHVLADFFEVSQHPVDDGLLVGYDEQGIPVIVTAQDLESLTEEQLLDKMRKDPGFHDFKDGYSLKRVQVLFPDFKLPPNVLERNRIPRPGQISTAILVVDEKLKPVYKRNGEKAIYFIRPLMEKDLPVI